MKIGDRVYVHGYVDEIRKDTVIIRNEGGYFGTVKSEVLTVPPEYVRVVRCNDCIHFDGYFCHHKGYGDGYANYTPPIKSEDGFCDLAERKEV